MKKPISEAVILMAGSGSRLVAEGHITPKPLIRIAGRVVFSYAIDALQRAGIKTVHVVRGFNSDALLSGIKPLIPAGMELNSIHNSEWQKQNGISVLAAKPHVSSPFLLAMGDHLFSPLIIDLMLHQADLDFLNVAVDRKLDQIFDLVDAMKLKTQANKVTAIGKGLKDYDAIDTGLFVCPIEFFDYLDQAKRSGDCSLAQGVEAMAKDGRVRAIDIGDAWWQDIDTPEMLAAAEKILGDRPHLLTSGPPAR
jgi:1L-myo-inositol 1-phosphate cytidylyltransferase